MTLDQKIELLNIYLKQKDYCFYFYLNTISLDVYFHLEMCSTQNEIFLYLNNLDQMFANKGFFDQSYITLNQKLLIFKSMLHYDECGFFEYCMVNSEMINSKMILYQDLSDVYSFFLELKEKYKKL